jgi:hypothetical protein
MPSTKSPNEMKIATVLSSHQTLGWLLYTVVDINMVAAIIAQAPEVTASFRSALDFSTFARLNFMAQDHERIMTDVPEITSSTSDLAGASLSIRRNAACKITNRVIHV